MTVNELINCLNNLPKSWGDYQVMCLHMNDTNDLFENVEPEDEEELDEKASEEDKFIQKVCEILKSDPVVMSPVETLAKISISKSNKNRSLFTMPIDAIFLN